MGQSLDIQAEYISKAFEMVNSSGTGASVLGLCTSLGGLIPAAGLLLTNLADQSNPIQTSNVQVSDGTVAPNGQGVTWTTPNYMDLSVSVVANSIDDFQLTAALEACRKKAGISNPGTPPPLWTLTAIFPNALGQSRLYNNCVMMNGELGVVMGSNGRINCKTFTWRCYNAGLAMGTGGFSI